MEYGTNLTNSSSNKKNMLVKCKIISFINSSDFRRLLCW